MCSHNNERLYSCGHPRPQGPIRTLIAHAKPLLHPHSQPEPRQQTQLPNHKSAHQATSPPPQTSNHAIIFSNPFNDPTAPPPAYSAHSAHSSRHNSLSKAPSSPSSTPERELTPEERVAAGMEYMYAFLSSRSTPSSASSSRSRSIAPASEKQTSRRAAVGAA